MSSSNKILFTPSAWADYQYWALNDTKVFKKLNQVLESTRRTPFEGIGKPEALKHDLSGLWSRRITREHRLVYRYHHEAIQVISCRYHY
ncbi:MAG: Txe/YoeB family addiction module toxin [Cryomorphaceae bacterium]|jgi:toxin YoeB